MAWTDEQAVRAALGTGVLAATQMHQFHRQRHGRRLLTMPQSCSSRVRAAHTTNDNPHLLQLHQPLLDRKPICRRVSGEYSLTAWLPPRRATEGGLATPPSRRSMRAMVLLANRHPATTHGEPATALGPRRQANEYDAGFLGARPCVAGRRPTGPLGVDWQRAVSGWWATLSARMTAWMLIANWRHTRRRAGKPTLVGGDQLCRADGKLPCSPACARHGPPRPHPGASTPPLPDDGWSESDLGGAPAPFPYWPKRIREPARTLFARRARRQETVSLAGHPGRGRRKNGSAFDARLYVSPLTDAPSANK